MLCRFFVQMMRRLFGNCWYLMRKRAYLSRDSWFCLAIVRIVSTVTLPNLRVHLYFVLVVIFC